MTLKKSLIFITLTIGMLSCASATHRGVIAMKLNNTIAHVGIASTEVAVGDHVELYRNQCRKEGPGRDGVVTNCTKKGIGHGTITRVLSSDYSEVSFEPGVEFQEGDTVEKHRH